MLAVRWYLLAIADCMCLGYNDLAVEFCIECKELITKITTEEDYSDFYIIYGYILVLNNKFKEA